MEEGPLSCDSNTDQNASKIITSLIIFVEIKQKKLISNLVLLSYCPEQRLQRIFSSKSKTC